MQVFVISTPSASNAAIARRSRSSIHGWCLSRSAAAKSVPRGSVMVGIRTRRSRRRQRSHRSSHSTPARPSDSVSAMMCAWVDRHEVRGAEIVADLDLMLDRPLGRRAELPARSASSRRSASFGSRPVGLDVQILRQPLVFGKVLAGLTGSLGQDGTPRWASRRAAAVAMSACGRQRPVTRGMARAEKSEMASIKTHLSPWFVPDLIQRRRSRRRGLGWRPQIGDQPQDLGEQRPGHGNLGHLDFDDEDAPQRLCRIDLPDPAPAGSPTA